MKKYIFILVSLLTITLLGACEDSFTTEHLDKMLSAASTDVELSEYITKIEAVELERPEPGDEQPSYWYDINGTLSDSFDELPTKEQYFVFARIVELMQENQGEIIGNTEFFCGEGISCNIKRIDLTTSNHTYGVEYYEYMDSSLFWMDDTIVYDHDAPDGKYVDPLAKSDEAESDHESEASDEKEEAQLSADFLEYNEKYYFHYKNSLDLIGSNFELLYEGNASPLLIDDLITWTNEFNEVLDVYEQDAVPMTDKDEELYSITTEMIEEQREANKYILSALETMDGSPLITAGEHLEQVVVLYLEGYSLMQSE